MEIEIIKYKSYPKKDSYISKPLITLGIAQILQGLVNVLSLGRYDFTIRDWLLFNDNDIIDEWEWEGTWLPSNWRQMFASKETT